MDPHRVHRVSSNHFHLLLPSSSFFLSPQPPISLPPPSPPSFSSSSLSKMLNKQHHLSHCAKRYICFCWTYLIIYNHLSPSRTEPSGTRPEEFSLLLGPITRIFRKIEVARQLPIKFSVGRAVCIKQLTVCSVCTKACVYKVVIVTTGYRVNLYIERFKNRKKLYIILCIICYIFHLHIYYFSLHSANKNNVRYKLRNFYIKSF